MVGLGVAGRKDKAFSPLCLCPKPLHGPGRDPSRACPLHSPAGEGGGRACPLHSPARPCGGQAGHPLPYSRPCPLGQTVGEEISKKDKGQSWAQGTGASHLPSQPCCTGGGGRSGAGDNPGALPEEFNVGPEPRGRTQHLALPAPPTERFPLWQGLWGVPLSPLPTLVLAHIPAMPIAVVSGHQSSSPATLRHLCPLADPEPWLEAPVLMQPSAGISGSCLPSLGPEPPLHGSRDPHPPANTQGNLPWLVPRLQPQPAQGHRQPLQPAPGG